MEHKIHHQKSTKKLLNKIFHPGNSKKSTQVSPSSSPPNNHEWVPAYMSTSAASYNQYEHEKPGNRSTPNSPSALITTYYNSYTTVVPTPVQNVSRNKQTTHTEDYHSDGDDNNSTTGRKPISMSSTCSVKRSNSVQRRYSFSNIHESGRQRLIAAKRAEYQEKMDAFDDLIQRRRGSTLRLALAPDVASY